GRGEVLFKTARRLSRVVFAAGFPSHDLGLVALALEPARLVLGHAVAAELPGVVPAFLARLAVVDLVVTLANRAVVTGVRLDPRRREQAQKGQARRQREEELAKHGTPGRRVGLSLQYPVASTGERPRQGCLRSNRVPRPRGHHCYPRVRGHHPG